MPYLAILVGALLALAPQSKAAESTTHEAPDASVVVASQGGVKLTLGDVDSYAYTIPDDKRGGVFRSPTRIKTIVSGMLVRLQLAVEAKQLGLASQTDVQAQIERATRRILASARMTQLRERLQAEVPDMTALAHERYLANPGTFKTLPKVDVKQILVSTDDRGDVQAKALADKLYAQLQQDPSKFAAYIKQYSDAPHKKDNHGLFKDATSDRYVKAFRDAAAAMERPGQIAAPVKSKYGYHILKAVSLEPASIKSFDEVKPELTEKLEGTWIAKRIQHHLDVLRNQTVDLNQDAYRSLRSRYLDSGLQPAIEADDVPDRTNSVPKQPAVNTASKAG